MSSIYYSVHSGRFKNFVLFYKSEKKNEKFKKKAFVNLEVNWKCKIVREYFEIKKKNAYYVIEVFTKRNSPFSVVFRSTVILIESIAVSK